MHVSKHDLKSVTFSKHTLQCTGFVHKLRNVNKIKTVPIHPVDAETGPTRAYRNVALSHIKNLRNYRDPSSYASDATPLTGNGMITRRSFFHDETLKHALDPKKPILNPEELNANQQQQGFMKIRANTTNTTARVDSMYNPLLHDSALAKEVNLNFELTQPKTIRKTSKSSSKLLSLLSAPHKNIPTRRLSSEDHRYFLTLQQQHPTLTIHTFLQMKQRMDEQEAEMKRQNEIVFRQKLLTNDITNLNELMENDKSVDNNQNIGNMTRREENQQDVKKLLNEPCSSVMSGEEYTSHSRSDGEYISDISELTPQKSKEALEWDMLNFKPPRIMGLDIGTRYIGIALSDESITTATPFKTIDLMSTEAQNNQVSLIRNIQADYRVSPQKLAIQLNAIRRKYNVICTVVGLPESDFNKHMYAKIHNFVQNMQNLHGLGNGPFEVCFVDEHHTTLLARKRILDQEEADNAHADKNLQYSHTGHGKDRLKKLAQKSKLYDDKFQKMKNIDSEAAALILDRFLQLIPTYGEKHSEEAAKRFTCPIWVWDTQTLCENSSEEIRGGMSYQYQ